MKMYIASVLLAAAIVVVCTKQNEPRKSHVVHLKRLHDLNNCLYVYQAITFSFTFSHHQLAIRILSKKHFMERVYTFILNYALNSSIKT